jgi:transposase
MSNLFWLTDAQMARLEPFFPKSHGKPRVDDRRVLSGIIFINVPKTVMRDATYLKAHRTATSLRSKKGEPTTKGAV